MKITKKDIGREVVNGWGEVETIIAFDEGDTYPVKTENDDEVLGSYTEDGVLFTDRPESYDNLVRFLDEENELTALMYADLLTLAGE